MRYKNYFYFLILMLFSCSNPGNNSELQDTSNYIVETNNDSNIIKFELNEDYDCLDEYIPKLNTDTVKIYLDDSNDLISKLKLYKNNSSKIGCIEIIHSNDSIPSSLSIFKNVPEVIITGCTSIKGISIFENVRKIHFRCYIREIPREIEKLDKLTSISFEMCVISYDLNLLTKLNKIEIVGSRLDSISWNFNNLKCLKELTIRIYEGKTFDLSNIKLNELPSLEKLSIHSYKDNLNGIPYGIENKNLKLLKIKHPNLEPNHKRLLDSLKNSI